MEQRLNQQDPGISPDRCGATRQCCLRSAPVGFENKRSRVRLGSNFIGCVSGRVYPLKKMIYARRVRSDSDFRTREDL